MGATALLLAGVAVFFNISVLYWKFTHGRQNNAYLDAAVLGGVMWLFSGTLGALIIGTIASALFSIFLISSPPSEELFEDW